MSNQILAPNGSASAPVVPLSQGLEDTTLWQSMLAIANIYSLYGCKTELSRKNLQNTYLTWNTLSAESGWMKFMKYKLAAFFSYHQNESFETPKILPTQLNTAKIAGVSTPQAPNDYISENDNPGILLGGKFHRWLRVFLNKENEERKLSFLSSILQSKKGMPRPTDEEVSKAEYDAFIKLTTSQPPEIKEDHLDLDFDGKGMNWADKNELGEEVERLSRKINRKIDKNRIIEEITRTVNEIIQDNHYEESDKFRYFLPSTSANYIATRSELGAIGAILSDTNIIDDLRRPKGFVEVDEGYTETTETREEEFITKINDEKLQTNFRIFMERVTKKAKEEKPVVELKGLKESLKIRVISKGPPFIYTTLKPIQKKMHDLMRILPVFSLIGTPDTEEILEERLGRNVKDNEVFVSGDYEDATNNISSWASEAVAFAMATKLRLPSIEREILIESLTKHVILNPEASKKITEKERSEAIANAIKFNDSISNMISEYSQDKMILETLEAIQTNGQLMGSVTSFIVLCIINCAITRLAIELAENRKYTLQDLKALINGDDVLFKSNLSAYLHWKYLTKLVGLKESIGKTYCSKKFVQINSRNYLIVKEREEQAIFEGRLVSRKKPYLKVKFVNYGLVKGYKRSQASSSQISKNDLTDINFDLADRAKDLIFNSPEDIQDKVYNLFMHEHQKLFKQLNPIPLFAPKWIGGLGLPITKTHGPSELDLRMARKIIREWHLRRPKRLEMKEGGWQMRNLANKRLPKPETFWAKDKYEQTSNENIEKSMNEITNILTLNLLFDSSHPLKSYLFSGMTRKEKKQFEKIVKIDDEFSHQLLYHDSDNLGELNKIIKINKKLWRPRGGIPTQGLTLEQLLTREYMDYYPIVVINNRWIKTTPKTTSHQVIDFDLTSEPLPEKLEAKGTESMENLEGGTKEEKNDKIITINLGRAPNQGEIQKSSYRPGMSDEQYREYIKKENRNKQQKLTEEQLDIYRGHYSIDYS